MSVSSATVGQPATVPTSAMSAPARAPAPGRVMNAPLPNVTSITRPWSPAASFLDRIDPVISGIDSTVPVTSRIA